MPNTPKDDDHSLFEQQMSGVTPLKKSKKVTPIHKPKPQSPRVKPQIPEEYVSNPIPSPSIENRSYALTSALKI